MRYSEHIAELALAHRLTDKVQAADFRADLMEQRREMMGPLVGWTTHFMLGFVLCVAAIATVGPRLSSNNQVVHGLVLGVADWVVVIILFCLSTAIAPLAVLQSYYSEGS